MGFTDWGKSKEEVAQREREHKEELRRIKREADAEIAQISKEMQESRKAHADYRNWLYQTGRTDVSFEDWRAGRYVHIVVSKY